ncbi:hypothetical protein [Litoribrevibacter albus]|uniref:CopL family metal-binding regulatory protein n=1 Tax=Litoribrevibacter albus TaxID=1473156 RepID=A0AA37S8I1_9GAMM|nr:hypothetical protein [Litoribrevibacter albus]GLQ30324.1 hypothetical protein GCM10007876_08020 [Litoribrevibacter albus]
MSLRLKICIVLFSLLAFVSQSYANALMGVSMANHSVAHQGMGLSSVTSDTDVSMSGMSGHCPDMGMAEMSQANLSGSDDSSGSLSDSTSDSKDDCCSDVCQCAIGVCSTHLFDNPVSIKSFDPSSQPLFVDHQYSIVRLAASLYRPPISA